jgi:pimeloyl-ACP methyl ester carboxylesterase
MRLYCTGTGSPAIVIETGLGSTSTGWMLVQEKLSALTRVCTYDRSGLGWSEPRPRPRDAEVIVRELHTLLDLGTVQRPVVLVGHSAGGLYDRVYARKFPDEVAGMVFVDSATPEQMSELPGFREHYESDKRQVPVALWTDRLRVWSGVERLIGTCHSDVDKGFEKYAELYDAKECRPEYVDGDFNEFLDLETTLSEAARLTSFGNKPVLILSSDPDHKGPHGRNAEQATIWDREQERLKSLSPLSWRVIARGSGHTVFKDRQDLVVDQITLLLRYLRGGPAPPFGNTSTQ